LAAGLFLTLDQTQWYRDNFSSTNKLTGTIWTDNNRTVAKNLTGFTIVIRMYKGNRWGDHFGKTADIVVAANGTWSYAVQQNEIPPPDIFNVVAEISASGSRETTLNRQELNVLEGPTV